MKTFLRFLKNESGATAIEYGLIVALISVVVVAGATVVGTQLGLLFDGIGGEITDAIPD